MTEKTLFDDIVKDVCALAKRSARGRPPQVSLSPDVVRRLKAVGVQNDLPDLSAPPASPPAAVIPAPPVAPPPAPKRAAGLEDSLAGIADEISKCALCPLCKTRRNTVPGEGHPRAQIVFVGEAPGADEDAQGRPFVGRAGQLLTTIIENAMKLSRDEVFICNVLKCRPPENRTPSPDEVCHCEPYLIRQLALLQPKVICALGGTAAQTLLKTAALVGQLRGKWHAYHGIPLRVTYHPAYLLRNEADKRKAWEDVKEILKQLRVEDAPPS